MTNEEYETQMAREAHNRTMEIERAPLADRKTARADWLDAMRNPSLVAERIEWLLSGDYGYGQMVQARNVIAHPRMNREAALCQLVARYEWRCPARFAAEAWHQLTKDEQTSLTIAVTNVVINASLATEE